MIHTVVQGEFLSSIAKKFGFRDYRTIWDDPQNAKLKKSRPDPNVLYPGDQLYIPDKEQKIESRATGAVHRFEVPDNRVTLRIALRDFDDRPIANTACELDIFGAVTKHTSNSEGMIERNIPPEPASGMLRIPDLAFELNIEVGHLDPPDEVSGYTARLTNLGYLDPFIASDDDDLNVAIQEFQCDHKLPVTGEIDPATKARLAELHGV
jgi:N-acetylmuramoyl-L-alanine amidase